MARLKSIHVPRGYDGLHIEVPGALINIYVGLHNTNGEEVTNISINADGPSFFGTRFRGHTWRAIWGRVNRKGGGCRIIKTTSTE